MLCQVVTYSTHNMWSSIVLLECDAVGLSLHERNNIALNNCIPIAYSSQMFGDNNCCCLATFCYASSHHNTASTKRSTLNNVSVCIAFSYTVVNPGSAITAVYVETGFICDQDIGPILSSES